MRVRRWRGCGCGVLVPGYCAWIVCKAFWRAFALVVGVDTGLPLFVR